MGGLGGGNWGLWSRPPRCEPLKASVAEACLLPRVVFTRLINLGTPVPGLSAWNAPRGTFLESRLGAEGTEVATPNLHTAWSRSFPLASRSRGPGAMGTIGAAGQLGDHGAINQPVEKRRR